MTAACWPLCFMLTFWTWNSSSFLLEIRLLSLSSLEYPFILTASRETGLDCSLVPAPFTMNYNYSCCNKMSNVAWNSLVETNRDVPEKYFVLQNMLLQNLYVPLCIISDTWIQSCLLLYVDMWYMVFSLHGGILTAAMKPEGSKVTGI